MRRPLAAYTLGALGAVLAAALLLSSAPATAPAQERRDSVARPVRDSLRLPSPAATPASPQDSLRPPVSPGRAFLLSLAMPGLAQSRLRRHAAGAFYFTIEAVSMGMLLKTSNELRIAREHQRDVVIGSYAVDPATGAPRVDSTGAFIPADTAQNRYVADRVRSRRTHVEDWIATLVFNHLFSGADAFVSSLLWDLPARVTYRPSSKSAALVVTLRR